MHEKVCGEPVSDIGGYRMQGKKRREDSEEEEEDGGGNESWQKREVA